MVSIVERELHTTIRHTTIQPKAIQPTARALKAMAHPLRLHILCVLGNTEVNVQDIVTAVGTSQSNISQHLAILRDKGIITSRKDANRVYYRIQDRRILNLIGMMRDVFPAHSMADGLSDT